MSKISSLFEVGQTIRTRIIEKPDKGKNWIGSFILDPKLKQEKIKQENKGTVEVGSKFDFKIEEIRDNDTIIGILQQVRDQKLRIFFSKSFLTVLAR